MAGKRNSATRALSEIARRGRPRRATHSTCAIAGNEDAEDEQPARDEPPTVEEQLEPTAVHEL